MFRQRNFWSNLWATEDAITIQRFSMAVQKGYAISFKSAFPADNFGGVIQNKLSSLVPTGFVLMGQ